MASRLPRHGLSALAALLLGCGGTTATGLAGPSPVETLPPAPMATPVERAWHGGTVYFLLLDRFANGDPTNDDALGRARDAAPGRGFEGGDLKGVLQRLEAGWFDSLGVTAIWMTPFVEQVRGPVDEGTGKTYGFHGYWARDWTAVDPAFGTGDDLRAVVDAAHRRGIRVLMDAVINHTGPATATDPAWPADWVRTSPTCTYTTYLTTTACTLVANLPDVLTERDTPAALPPFLVDKWRAEGRLERERAELETFFARTGFPRTPRHHLIKWLTDWVRRYGIDGYRMDTAKHFGEGVSAELFAEARRAFDAWKAANPGKAVDGLGFLTLGEVYGWAPQGGRAYDFGDRRVDYFAHGYQALINFAFKADTARLDDVFTRYALLARGGLGGGLFLNYLASHDDGAPFDRRRQDPMGTGTRLLLAPGGAQVYYGDELARPLEVPGATGDANLRGAMNWGDLALPRTRIILEHWRKLGRFRRAHPAVGAGEHRRHQAQPYIFSRQVTVDARTDRVLIALDQPEGAKVVPVFGVFPDGTTLEDAYSGATGTVRGGVIRLPSGASTVLLAPR
ncbi:MAG: alpha-amylase family glycosyl hydrolase [Gemmatimonadales bacterium]|nr:alpha-amylase family glycosyl hydrolase [Gemmatimonadales bacterium]